MTAPHPDAPPVASAGAEATPPDVQADRARIRDRPAGDIAAEIVAEHGLRGRGEGEKDG